MKFPLRERPFASVPLSPSERQEYSRVIRDVVDATMDEFDRYVRVDERRMKKKHWKPIKSREDVTVYKQLSRDPEARTFAGESMRRQPADDMKWPLPKVVGVGTIAGTLDDIMYGVVTPDAQSIAIKTSYINDELLDSAVLCEMQTATREDPFRFEGMKWMVMGHSTALNAVVWPRDFVFVESTGVETLVNGERIGYHALHSVEHAACPEIESWGIIRCRFSMCYLYKQHRQGTVELYMVNYGAPGGNPPETIALASSAATLIGIWKSMWCAQNKKLTWLLEDETARKRFRAAVNALSSSRQQQYDKNDKSQCHLCNKTIRSFRSVASCQLCDAWVCSRCRVVRKLSYSSPKLELRQRTVDICKRCMIRVTSDDAHRIAREHYVGHEDPVVKRDFESEPVKERASSDESGGTLSSSMQYLELLNDTVDPVDMLLESRSGDSFASDVSSFPRVETIEDWERATAQAAQSTARLPVSFADDEPLDHQQRLLMQIQSLCVAAEETFQITALNASYIKERPTNPRSKSGYTFN